MSECATSECVSETDCRKGLRGIGPFSNSKRSGGFAKVVVASRRGDGLVASSFFLGVAGDGRSIRNGAGDGFGESVLSA